MCPIDARLWLLWSLTILITASSTRNPLYTLLLVLVTAVVGVYCTPERDGRLPLRLTLLTATLGALFTGLTALPGETVLLHLPQIGPWGGAVTLESLTFGATNGLTLAAILGGFLVFNRATSTRDLVNLVPGALHEAGVIISIALTFIPQTRLNLTRIREAQAIRGHRVRTVKDWLPLLIPLLIGGLERSLNLAEALVARGYGAVTDRQVALRTQTALVLGLTLLLVGWLEWLLSPAWKLWRWVAFGGLLGGGGLLLGTVWANGRHRRRTSYRPHRLGWRDGAVLLGCGLTLSLLLHLAGRESLYYTPYPRLTLPPFDPLIGIRLLGLLTPAITGHREGDR